MLVFGIFFFLLETFLLASSEECLNMRKFFQFCGQGKEVKIAWNYFGGCEKYFQCKNNTLTMHECKSGTEFINGECRSSGQCLEECPVTYPSDYEPAGIGSYFYQCATGMERPHSTLGLENVYQDGNYEDNCITYYVCREGVITRTNCGIGYFLSPIAYGCNGSKDNNVCTNSPL